VRGGSATLSVTANGQGQRGDSRTLHVELLERCSILLTLLEIFTRDQGFRPRADGRRRAALKDDRTSYFLPSPLVGEGGIGGLWPPLFKNADALHRLWSRSDGETGEGYAASRYVATPHPARKDASHLLPQGEKGRGALTTTASS
jgi:hypothetical protein